MSQRHRHRYAAVLPHGLPDSKRRPSREFPAPQNGYAPHPAQIRQKRRFLANSSPSRSPDPHHLAVLTRPGLVRAAPTLPGTTRIRLPSTPSTCCDRPKAEVSHLHS